MYRSESDAPAARPAGGDPSPDIARRGRGSLHWLITLLASLAFAGNGVALSAISFALPGIRREWDLSPPELGLLSAAVSAGQVVGALAVGSLADRWGRRRLFAATIALAAVATGLAGLAPSPHVVTVLLFIAGFGISGVAPVAASLIGEFAPPGVRGQMMTWTQILWAGGWLLSAVGGAALAASLGWRWIIALGAAPVLLSIVGLRLTPESPRFLLAHGRRAEAEALVRELEARYGVHVPLPSQQRATRQHPLESVRELLGPKFRRRTISLWVTWFVMVAGFNGPVIWLPAILAGAGGSDALAARLSLLVGLWMLPAVLVVLVLIDRVGRRPLMLVALAVASAGTFILALSRGDVAVVIGGGALAGGLLAAWPIVLGYSAELYPTRIRATAAGWAGAVSRSGGVVAPLLLGILLNSWGGGLGLALGVFAVLLALAVVLFWALGEETRGRTLEELSV